MTDVETIDFPVPNFVDMKKIEEAEPILMNILEKKQLLSKVMPEVGELNISVKTACCSFDAPYNIKKLTQYVEQLIKDSKTLRADGKRVGKKTPIKGIKFTKTDDTEEEGILVKNSKANSNFYNSVSISVEIRPEKCINLMIFTNGRITCTGSKEDNDGMDAANHLLTQMKQWPDIFEVDEEGKTANEIKDAKKILAESAQVTGYEIVMINSNFFVGFLIDNHKLYNILIEKRRDYNLFTSYDPRVYQGVKIFFMWNTNQSRKNGVCQCEKKKCKFSAKKKGGNGEGDCRRISVAVFGTGKILITGAKNNTQLYDCYNYVTKVLQDNYKDIVQYSTEEKQRELNKSGKKNSVVKKLKIIA